MKQNEIEIIKNWFGSRQANFAEMWETSSLASIEKELEFFENFSIEQNLKILKQIAKEVIEEEQVDSFEEFISLIEETQREITAFWQSEYYHDLQSDWR